ncbi:MAG: ferritin family protein [Acidobacteria bacterium]|nr:ferritin family protein [Acidobacteriota bacterium]
MSTPHLDVRRATLLRAIQIETRNARVYDSLAQLFQGYDDSVTAIFREMAAEERQHGAELEHRYGERFGPLPSPAEEPKEVIEAPDLDDPEALIFDSMTVEQALEVGLRAEETAREFYARESSRTTDPELQKVYRELAEFEETHVRLLNEKLAEKRRTRSSTVR